MHAGFVHHTVNANDYTARRGARRSSAASTPTTRRSRGWSDIGYNFLVDRFGRIWEGRYGGVDRPVVGAHTLGYNDNSFAMSAIGNFETAPAVRGDDRARTARCSRGSCRCTASTPPRPAEGRHQATSRRSTGTATPARPRARASTCTPRSRRSGELAPRCSKGWAGRELESDLAGSAHPDLVVRRASDGKAFMLPIGPPRRRTRSGKPVPTGLQLKKASGHLKAGDWDRDGNSDLIVRVPRTVRSTLTPRRRRRAVRGGARGSAPVSTASACWRRSAT